MYLLTYLDSVPSPWRAHPRTMGSRLFLGPRPVQKAVLSQVWHKKVPF